MPLPQSIELYDEVVGVIEHNFRLRRSDAIPKAIHQIKEWTRTADIMETRGNPSFAEIKRRCDAIQTLIKTNVGKYTPRDGAGPTPEMACRPPGRDNIQSLEDAGRLSGEHVAAIREIQRIVEVVTSCCNPRGQSFEKGAGRSRSNGLMPTEIAYRWSQIYVPWHRAMAARADKRLKKLAGMVIFDGISLDAARRTLRMSYERGHLYLTDSVDLYIELKENVGSRADREQAIARAEASA